MSQELPLFRLLYVSQATPDTMLSIEPVMRDILLVSHRLNRRDGITGLLISYGAWFAQVLEGEEAAVESCYARIARDPRHVEATVRLRERAGVREFDRWSMCGLTLCSLDDALLQRPDIAFDVWTAPPEAVKQMLAGVSRRHASELDAQHARLGAEVSDLGPDTDAFLAADD